MVKMPFHLIHVQANNITRQASICPNTGFANIYMQLSWPKSETSTLQNYIIITLALLIHSLVQSQYKHTRTSKLNCNRNLKIHVLINSVTLQIYINEKPEHRQHLYHLPSPWEMLNSLPREPRKSAIDILACWPKAA